MSRGPRQTFTGIIADFGEHLAKETGRSSRSIHQGQQIVTRFLKFVDSERIDHISEAQTVAFFAQFRKKETTVWQYSAVVTQFLKFAIARLPVPVTARGDESPRASAPTKKELALKAKWTLEKLIDEKDKDADLIAQLARKVIDFYMYAEKRIKGEPENLDELYRFADECRELIQNNLSLFMSLSAQGKNVHTKIDERVQR